MKALLLAILVFLSIIALAYFVPLLMLITFKEGMRPTRLTRLIVHALVIVLVIAIIITAFSRVYYGFKECGNFYSFWRGFKKYYMACFELERGDAFNITSFLEIFDKAILMLLDGRAYLTLIKSCYKEDAFRQLIEVQSRGLRKLPTLKVIGTRQHLIDQLNRELPYSDYALVVEGKPTLKLFKYPLLHSPRVMEVVKAELYRVVKVNDGVQIYKLPTTWKSIENVNATSSALIRLARPSLPTSDDGVLVGLDERGRELRLDFDKAVHTLILGATGTGKTTLAYVIGKQLADRGHYVLYLPLGDEVVDFGFAKVLVGVHLTIDLFKLLREEDVVNILSDVIIATFGYDYRMSPIQLDVLSRVVSGSKSVEEMMSMIDAMYGSEREDVRSACLALKRRLMYINNVAFKRGGKSIIALLKRHKCVGIDLSHLDDVARATFALALLHYLLKAWRHGKLYVIIDEVHRLTPVERNWRGVFERVMREGRKFGLRVIGITQSPTDLPKCVHDNVDLYFTFRLSSGAEVIADRLVGDIDSLKTLIISLPNRTCLVSYGGGWKKVTVIEAKTRDASLTKLCQEYSANSKVVSSLILKEGPNLLKRFIPSKENIAWLLKHKLFTEVGGLLAPTSEGLAVINALEIDGYDVLIMISKIVKYEEPVVAFLGDSIIKYSSLAKLLVNSLDKRKLISKISEYFKQLRVVKEMLLRGEIPKESYDLLVMRYKIFANKLESHMMSKKCVNE